MGFSLECTSCQHSMWLFASDAGRSLTCPRCNSPFTVPGTPPPANSGPPLRPVREAPAKAVPGARAAAPLPRRDSGRMPAVRPGEAGRRSLAVLWVPLCLLLLVGGGYAGWHFYLKGPDLPPLLEELPDGDIVVFASKRFLDAAPKGLGPQADLSEQLPGLEEFSHVAMVMRRSKDKPPLLMAVLQGKFDAAEVRASVEEQGFESETVEGHDLLVEKGPNPMGMQGAGHFGDDRAFFGSRDLVLAAVRVKAGEEKSLVERLRAEDPELLSGFTAKDFFMYAHDDGGAGLGMAALFLGPVTGGGTVALGGDLDEAGEVLQLRMVMRFTDEEAAEAAEERLRERSKAQQAMTVKSLTREGDRLSGQLELDLTELKSASDEGVEE